VAESDVLYINGPKIVYNGEHMKSVNIDKLREIVKQVDSLSSVMRLLGGIGRLKTKRIIAENGIDTSHFIQTPKQRKRSIEEYLSNEYPLSSDHLKKKLFKSGLKEKKCERCLRQEWEGHPIPLELHHIDGNKLNNNLSNIRILCRNCHGLESNHKGAAAKRKKKIRVSKQLYIKTIPTCINACEVCKKVGIVPKGRNYDTIYGIMAKHNLSFLIHQELERPLELNGLYVETLKTKHKRSRTRQEAGLIKRKVKNRPSIEEIEKIVWEMPMESVGKHYGVTSNTIKDWIKDYNTTIKLPPQGYWIRRKMGYSHEESLVSQGIVRIPLRQPTEEQAKIALSSIESGSSLRKAGKSIGFDHETTKAALVRFKMISTNIMGHRGCKFSKEIGGDKSSSTITNNGTLVFDASQGIRP
jgi:hypothetical protein